ncbi:MAG: M48 family metalloprotease, partial [Blastochloris sp.]|nr:M48 family metalloprotease [Blastochloris sp.]
LTSPPPPARGEEREHARILASYGGAYDAPELQATIEATVERLVAASERPDLRYRVTILNSPSVNAFALPSGSLYVTRGLLALTNDRAELASVLAHEMAHVIARHAVAREEQVRQAAIVSKVISDVLQDPQLGALSMARSKLSIASFSRQQELEADAIGVGISARAGFDPYGASRFLTSLARHGALRDQALGGEPSRVSGEAIDFLSTHPSTPDRLAIAVTYARQFAGPGGTGERERDRFLARIDGLTYGDDPSEGYVRGRRFIHPKLGFTLLAPEGFSLENTPQAVLGASTGGREALRLDAARVGGTEDLATHLATGWIDGVETSSVERMTLNGFEAATAVARGREWSFRLYAVRFGSEVYRLIFAARSLTPDIDRQFRAAAQTFRRVSLQEADNLRPLRLKVVTIQPGDTAEGLSGRMAPLDRPLERFLVLNGMERGQPLQPGQKIKIVTE